MQIAEVVSLEINKVYGATDHAVVGVGSSQDGDLSCDAVEQNPILLFDHFCVTTAVLRKVLEKGFKTIADASFLSGSPTATTDSSALMSALDSLVPSFFQFYQRFAHLHRILLGITPLLDNDIDEYEGSSGGPEADDEDESYYYESCGLTQSRTLPHQHPLLHPAIKCLQVSLKDMSIIPVSLISLFPVEMSPGWLNYALTMSYQHLLAEFGEDTTIAGSALGSKRNNGYHTSSCISSILFLSECLSCSKYVPHSVGTDKRRVPNRPVKGVAYSLAGLFVRLFVCLLSK